MQLERIDIPVQFGAYSVDCLCRNCVPKKMISCFAHVSRTLRLLRSEDTELLLDTLVLKLLT